MKKCYHFILQVKNQTDFFIDRFFNAMIKKKENTRIFVLVILVLVLSSLSVFSKTNISIFFHNTYESLMSKDPGFSSSRNLVDKGGNIEELSIMQRINPLILKAGSIINHISDDTNKGMDNIEIFIKFKNYKRILDDRENSINRGFLEDPMEVNGEIKFGERIYKAKFRLKGDLDDHWISNTRLSLRVKLKDGKTIYGMNSFSIQKPRSRQHPYEQAFQQVMNQTSNLSLNTHYAKVIVNGDDWGIMNIEEHFSKEFLEKKQKKESLIFRFSDDRKWKNYEKSSDNVFASYLLSDSRLHGTFYNSKRYLEDEHYRKVYSYVMQERLLENHSYLYSTKKHMELFYASLFWNSFHTLADHNTKYYFNPYSLELSPISSDQDIFTDLNSNFVNSLKDHDFNLNFRQIFKFSINEDNNDKFILNSLNGIKDAENYLNKFKEIFPLDEYKDVSILKNNQKKVISSKENILETLKNISDKNYKIKSDTNISEKQLSDLLDFVHVRHFVDGSFEFFNLLPFDIEIKEIFLDDEPYNINPFIVPAFDEEINSSTSIITNLVGIFDNRIDVISTYKGEARKTKVYPSMIKGVFNPLRKEASIDNTILKERNYKDFYISPGMWFVDDPLLVDGNLSMDAGTKLIFSEDAYLIVKGKVNFNGSENNQIEFLPKDKSWKGFYLISDKESKSTIKNLEVRSTSAMQVGVLNLTGGFTIYNSDILLKNIRFLDSTAEDSINIVNSEIEIDNLNIERSISDGLDCDFCEGIIKNTFVNKIGGDAIDFSGSKVDIENVKISDVQDKAISVGEQSFIRISEGEFINIGVGVASKDSSETYINNSTIRDFELFAAMTYQKKMIFGTESNLYVNTTNTSGDNPFRSQKGTNLYVDAVKILESDLDVEEMYSEGVMKK